MDTTNLIGYFATTLTTAMSVPQLVKILKSKHARDVSLLMFLMNLAGAVLWLTYGIMLSALPIVLGNIVAIGIISVIIYYKLKLG